MEIKNTCKCYSKATHISNEEDIVGEDHAQVIIQDDHKPPYIGDFPPKDQYKKGIYD